MMVQRITRGAHKNDGVDQKSSEAFPPFGSRHLLFRLSAPELLFRRLRGGSGMLRGASVCYLNSGIPEYDLRSLR